MKYIYALACTAIFIIVLISIYLIHINYFGVDVVLYSALGDAAIALGVAGLLFLFVFRAVPVFNGFEKTLVLLIWLLGGYAFAISIPTVLDRSLSFYILEKLQQRGGGIRESSMSDVFIHEYIPEFRLVDVRLTEQLESGSVVIEDGCVRLTEKGQRLASFSHYFRRHFLPKRRLLGGQYSDDLVDPFKQDDAVERGYEC